jgi:hypothetical protein
MDTSRLSTLAISDSGFVFDPRTGHSYTVNASGLTVLRDLKKGLPLSRVLEHIGEIYDTPGNAEAGLQAFADALAAYELLESNSQMRDIP